MLGNLVLGSNRDSPMIGFQSPHHKYELLHFEIVPGKLLRKIDRTFANGELSSKFILDPTMVLVHIIHEFSEFF